MKKFIDRFDYLWKGDIHMLTTMWLSILLATVLVVQVVVSIAFK